MVKITDDPKLAQAGDLTSSGDIWIRNNVKWCRYATENGPVWVSASGIDLYVSHGWELNGSAEFDPNGRLIVDIRRE